MSPIVSPESSYKPYACRTTQSFPQTVDWFRVSPADSGLVPSLSCRQRTGSQYLLQTPHWFPESPADSTTHLQDRVDEQEVVGGFPAAEVFSDLQRLLALLHPLGDGRRGDHHGEGGCQCSAGLCHLT